MRRGRSISRCTSSKISDTNCVLRNWKVRGRAYSSARTFKMISTTPEGTERRRADWRREGKAFVLGLCLDPPAPPADMSTPAGISAASQLSTTFVRFTVPYMDARDFLFSFPPSLPDSFLGTSSRTNVLFFDMAENGGGPSAMSQSNPKPTAPLFLAVLRAEEAILAVLA
jgi:hypothetical protein